MAKVELKAPVVAEIAEAVKDAQSVVLVDYRGLTVDQDTALRKQLRAAGVTYKVYKNTMMKFARNTGFSELFTHCSILLYGDSAVSNQYDGSRIFDRLTDLCHDRLFLFYFCH